MQKITIADIAKKAGVSTATVSRVINKQGPVSAETEDRVFQAMSELKVRIPTGGKAAHHANIGMLIAGYDSPTPQASFFHEVVAGASAETDQMGSTFSFAPLSADSTVEPTLLRRGEIDGLIVAGVPIPDTLVEQYNRLPFPVVFIGRYLEHGVPLNYVAPDNVGGGRIAAQTLYDLGHRHICVLNGPSNINVFRDRLQGVQEIFSAHESTRIIVEEDFDEAAGYEATRAVLANGDLPSAILALSDWMAIGAQRAINEADLRSPEDISLIGFSDLPVTALLSPPLTTIRIPQRKLGALAVHLLHSLISKEISGPVGMIVPLELVVRQSTAAVRSV